MKRIGIGVTTYNRYALLNLFLEQINKHTKVEHKVYVWDDTLAQKGVAYGKNMCIHNLRECEDIFLFDDDCFPIVDNWHEPFVNSGLNHLVYCKDKEHHNLGKFIITDGIVKTYEGSAGCFLYYNKDVIDTVGYFNTEYYKYGYEHAGYSERIYKIGLTLEKYMCLDNTSKFIHSLDLDGKFNNYENTITLEKEDKISCINKNKDIFLREIESNQIYYPFNPH